MHIAQVIEDPSAPLKRYDPGHPDAGPDGYVAYPDINPLTEMVDLMGATRAYGLNGSAVQAEKGMIPSALGDRQVLGRSQCADRTRLQRWFPIGDAADGESDRNTSRPASAAATLARCLPPRA